MNATISHQCYIYISYRQFEIMYLLVPGSFIIRHIESGTKRWVAELRRVSVIFVNLTQAFTEDKLPVRE